jgi:uncharacterized membrane protein
MKHSVSKVDTKTSCHFDRSFIALLLIVCICEAMAISIMWQGSNTQTLIYALVFLLMLIGSLTLFILMKKFSARPETLFLAMFAFLCFFAIWAFPPFANADGNTQYYRAFQIAQGGFICSQNDIETASLPSNIVPAALTGESALACIQRTLGDHIDFSTLSAYSIRGMAMYSPIAFLPSVFGIKIATAISSSSWLAIYLARFANVICVGWILYLSIKYIPYGKNLLIACSLLPMSLDVINSSSPDGLTIALCIALVSFVLYHRACTMVEPLSWQQLAVMFFLMICIALTKIVYLPLIFIVFLLPGHCFSSQRVRIPILCLFSGIATVANLAWLATVSGLTFNPDPETINAGEQIANIYSSPIRYLMICISTTLNDAENWLTTMAGISLGALNQAIAPGFILALIGVIVGIFCFDNDIDSTLDRQTRVVFIIIAFLIFGLILTSEYVTWTAVQADSIEGIQGRYFLPILPLVLLAAKPHKKLIRNDGLTLSNVWIFYFCIDICVLATALMYVI